MTSPGHALLAAMIAACGKPDPAPASATATIEATPAIGLDSAAVNALVPPALRDQLVFERRDLVVERGKRRTTYTLAAPRGWGQDSKLFAQLRPDDRVGYGTRFDVGSNCDGECAPKPWAEVADRVNFAPRARGKITKDERAPGRRTMISEIDAAGDHQAVVVVAWWTEGAGSYHTCTASLGAPFRAAAAAFDRACQAVAIDGAD
jgi:hypothetical protein